MPAFHRKSDAAVTFAVGKLQLRDTAQAIPDQRFALVTIVLDEQMFLFSTRDRSRSEYEVRVRSPASVASSPLSESY
jgi:hypothetical protein